MVISVSAVVGPSLASAILSVANWPWLFLVNLPIGMIGFAVGYFALPASPKSGGKMDLISTFLNIVAYGLLIYGLQHATPPGNLGESLVCIVVAVAAGWLLVRRCLPQQRPLFPVDLMRGRLFALSVGTSVASFIAQSMAGVALPFFFENELHHSQVSTGLLMTAWPLATGIAAPFAGRLADRYPAAILGSLGLGLLAVGLALLAILPEGASNADILWRMAFCGFGFGFFQAPNNRALLGSAPLARAGAAGGALAAARLSGQTFGATLAAILFGIALNGAVLSLWMGALFAITAIAVSLLRMRSRTVPA